MPAVKWSKRDAREVKGALSYFCLKYGAARVRAHLDIAGAVVMHLSSMRLLRLQWAERAESLASRAWRRSEGLSDLMARKYEREHGEAAAAHLKAEKKHRREAAWYGRLAAKVEAEGLPRLEP